MEFAIKKLFPHGLMERTDRSAASADCSLICFSGFSQRAMAEVAQANLAWRGSDCKGQSLWSFSWIPMDSQSQVGARLLGGIEGVEGASAQENTSPR